MRRAFLVLIFILVFLYSSTAQNVNIQYSGNSPQLKYAGEVLTNSLREQGYAIQKEPAEFKIILSVDSRILKAEAYSIHRQGKTIKITGGDDRGVIYGSFSLVEDLRNGISIGKVKAHSEQASLPFRALKFNLPWDSYREGYAMSQHTGTCKEVAFWKDFLDMMAENRFNALTLWNLHPFPYMIKSKNFPEACPFSNEEMENWHKLFTSIFQMASERGIDTYIVNWNIFVTPQFSKAHQVVTDNMENRIHYGKGDISEIVKRYTRECVTQVLEEYPELTGIGFTQGEAMRGMTAQECLDWSKETIIKGIQLADRKTKLIFRVPLSAQKETELITRNAMEELHFLDGPIWTEIKFNWSHAHSTPKLVKAHGGKLSETYFMPEPKNYRIAWMVRNEDFFCLRWGQPDFIRQHIAMNTQSYVGGYFVGSEGYIPAKDYFTKIDAPFAWKYAFQRQWLFYKLWGRLLYNPDTSDEVFRAGFVHRYGKKASPLLDAYKLVSSVPLRLASSFDFSWDFSLYCEGFMAMNKNSMDYISVERQIKQAPADPDYVSVADYVKTLSTGGSFDKGRITPPMLADMLEHDSRKALKLLQNIEPDNNNSLIYELTDAKVWANLGLYYSEKTKGAVALQTYHANGIEKNKQDAIRHLENALQYWDKVVEFTRPIYKDMPLAAYDYPHEGSERQQNNNLRFHWEKLRPDVARDIEIAKNADSY